MKSAYFFVVFGLSLNEQYFSFIPNQLIVLSAMAYKLNKSKQTNRPNVVFKQWRFGTYLNVFEYIGLNYGNFLLEYNDSGNDTGLTYGSTDVAFCDYS